MCIYTMLLVAIETKNEEPIVSGYIGIPVVVPLILTEKVVHEIKQR